MTRPSDSGASGVDWGAPIPVDGKRPERPTWLEDIVPMQWAVIEADGSYSPYKAVSSSEVWNWRGTGFGVVIRLPADHPYYRQPQPADDVHPCPEWQEAPQPVDTVTVGRMTEAEARKPWGHDGIGAARHVAILRDLGIIKPEPSRLDRFMAAHPDSDRATAEKALAWGEGE